MDTMFQKLVEMKKSIPDCTVSRQRLRSILSDYFPTEKQLTNSILNAYDEDIETKLKSSTDRTLMALQMIKVLQKDYGLTAVSALSAVRAWCYMLNYIEIANALSEIAAVPGRQSVDVPISRAVSSHRLGLGIYKAGVDFPVGEICLQVKAPEETTVFYGIGKNPNKIDTDDSFTDKTYIHVTDSHYLKLEVFGGSDNVQITASTLG